MPHTTVSTSTFTIDIADQADVEFAEGAARYLRHSGLSDDEIVVSLVDELGIDLTQARRITLTL